MAIVRWEPARDVASLQQDVNRVFASFVGPSASSTSTARWIPPVDLEEMDESFLLVADLPGVAADDVAIDVEGDVLTLSGARVRSRRDGAETVRSERGYGTFERRLTLPEGVDPEGITASFDRGVLEIEVPKPAKARPRRVSIQVGSTPRTIDGGHDDSGGEDAGAPARAPRGGSPEPAGAAA
ncbi:Hsp20/alpha crystallin family protein [Patulibacter sp. NPDC049589]|uniref:Hsp20/alpha crystallin family protein n=1 Tax=Patulibacter sp. NPDC049589 TaxID=3154731 RepID=UPI0034289FF1